MATGTVRLHRVLRTNPERIYRATVNGGPYILVAALGAGTTYTDTAVRRGVTYYYVVTAINSSGEESTYSNQASAKPK